MDVWYLKKISFNEIEDSLMIKLMIYFRENRIIL
jgi:hypothetical protein